MIYRVTVQVLSSYITLPLYALVTQVIKSIYKTFNLICHTVFNEWFCMNIQIIIFNVSV